jgi:hypothetical protein
MSIGARILFDINTADPERFYADRIGVKDNAGLECLDPTATE